jgi:peptidylamidoglycolate lyase
MKRNEFIKASSLGLLGATLPIRYMDKQEVILGHNNKRYKINTRWSQADAARYPVNNCHEMVQDKKGRILLLTDETRNNVLIYDKNGKILDSWGTEYLGAHGLTLFHENGEDMLFICDNSRHQVIKTTIDGRVLMTLDYPKDSGVYAKAEEYVPTETAIAPNGDIYVADGYGKDYIIQYNHKGEYIRHFGGKGDTPAHLSNAHGICVDIRNKANPCLVVSSRLQNAFKRYDLTGKYLETIDLKGAWVCRPVIKGEYLYAAVLQSNNSAGAQSGFVTILDKNNKVVSNLAGSTPQYQGNQIEEMYQTIKAFQYPHDVLIDDEECMYVAQWNSGKTYPIKLEPVI